MSTDIKDIFTYNTSTGALYQAITGDAASQNTVMDFGVASKRQFTGKKAVYFNVVVGDAFNTLTSLEIAVETDSDSGFATTKKQILIFNVARADLTAGKRIVSCVMPNQVYQRYMRVYFNVVGSNPSTGTVYAYLSDSPEPQDTQVDLVGA